jgi:hypothetical protein
MRECAKNSRNSVTSEPGRKTGKTDQNASEKEGKREKKSSVKKHSSPASRSIGICRADIGTGSARHVCRSSEEFDNCFESSH